MTNYAPSLHEHDGPRYLAIVEALAHDIESGVLRAGQRLPTQRALADRLGLSLGTVTRGYAEAERRGLVSGEVGRGTYVRGEAVAFGESPRGADGVDLSLGLPWTLPEDEEGRLLARTLAEVAADPLGELLRYYPETAPTRQRRAAAGWLRSRGVPASEGSVLVTPGAQHALSVVLGRLLRPGDTLLTEALTYPGVRSLAHRFGLRVRGVPLDSEGMLPDALAEACREGAAAAYLVPTAQNPTGATMGEARRAEIARVLEKQDVLAIEDDVHALMDPAPGTPLASFAPGHVIHLSTVSKGVAFGLRTAFVHAPERLVDELIAGIHGTVWMAPPLMTEVTLRWLADGTAADLARRKRVEMEARQAMVRAALPAAHGQPFALHSWLPLPDSWRSAALVDALERKGVRVAGAEAFAVGRGPAPNAVRICVGMPATRGELRGALDTIATTLARAPVPAVLA